MRGHTDLNHGPIDLQSIALPLSYTPRMKNAGPSNAYTTAVHSNVRSHVCCTLL